MQLVKTLQIDSLRAEITLFEAARAYAAADGRQTVWVEDLAVVAPLALRARRSEFMLAFFATQETEEKEIDQALQEVMGTTDKGYL